MDLPRRAGTTIPGAREPAMIDQAKRKRVMARSMRLGHCICDPAKGCPCDVFREKNVCPCAGERMPVAQGPVRLTRLVQKPGCASKIDQASLRNVLEGLPNPDDPRVLVGVAAGDDAGVFLLDEQTALVQTVDVFSPSVDDPYQFGQIAAANSLSDVYAMGGKPLTALSIIGFPIRSVDDDVMRQILRGGLDKMAEAGVSVIGGHSINDEEIKAGFAVTGVVDPSKILANAGARPGDRLIITKPIGTGIIAFAAQIDRAPAGAAEASAASMAALNRGASELAIEFGVHAMTDITGFGLVGHLSAMAEAGEVDVEVIWDDLPLLPGVLQCAADDIIAGAVERNRESSGQAVDADDSLTPNMLDICFDAQTSGGLLLAVPEKKAEELLKRLHEADITEAAMIGRVLASGTGRVAVRHSGRRRMPPAQAVPKKEQPAVPHEPVDACCSQGAGQEPSLMSCCENGHGAGSGEPGTPVATSDVAGVQKKFQDFLKASNAPGALDARTKKAVAIALSALAKCEPCLKIHIKKAREMGFSQEEIDEAAWMAIAFGGSPTMMFYNGLRRSS